MSASGYSIVLYTVLGRYSNKGSRSEKEYLERLADWLDGVDWEELTSTAQLVFFQVTLNPTSLSSWQLCDPQGMDSPGGDYLFVPDAAGDISQLTRACMNTHRCIGEQGAVAIYC